MLSCHRGAGLKRILRRGVVGQMMWRLGCSAWKEMGLERRAGSMRSLGSFRLYKGFGFFVPLGSIGNFKQES